MLHFDLAGGVHLIVDGGDLALGVEWVRGVVGRERGRDHPQGNAR